MRSFQFAQVFQKRRTELKLTQEEIAKYVGVSRAAVSKWEKGQSYPDITLLPKLATYFDLSIDTLLGYEPQMTNEKILRTYAELAEKLAQEPFEQVETEIDALLNEYYSCFPLLVKIVQLYVNYFKTASNPEAILQKALTICARVKQHSAEIELKNDALSFEALIHLLKGDAQQVLELLGEEPKLERGNDQLIATAHSMLGNPERAKEIMQVCMYQQLLGVISNGTESLLLEVDNTEHFDETVKRIQQLIVLYQMEQLQINSVLVFYVKAATGYMLQQRPQQALEMLESFQKICARIQFPLKLHGDDYFYKLDGWIERQARLSAQAPRDTQSIKKDLLTTVSKNPVFAPLHEDPTFKMIRLNLAHSLKIEEE